MSSVGGIAGDRLKSFIERIERLLEEKRDLVTDIGEVYKEAKGAGFDTKTMRLIVKERAMDKDDLDEQEALLDTYRRALGMLSDTPLGKAALWVTFADKSVPPEPDKPRRLAAAPTPSTPAAPKPKRKAKAPAELLPAPLPPKAHADATAAALAGQGRDRDLPPGP